VDGPPQPSFASDVERILRNTVPTLLQTESRRATGYGSCIVRGVDEGLWPPGAADCVLVVWSPDPEFALDDDADGRPGTQEHWARGTRRVAAMLLYEGFVVSSRRRRWDPHVDATVNFLAYRLVDGAQRLTDGPG
jgi:hypothetical protein